MSRTLLRSLLGGSQQSFFSSSDSAHPQLGCGFSYDEPCGGRLFADSAPMVLFTMLSLYSFLLLGITTLFSVDIISTTSRSVGADVATNRQRSSQQTFLDVVRVAAFGQ